MSSELVFSTTLTFWGRVEVLLPNPLPELDLWGDSYPVRCYLEQECIENEQLGHEDALQVYSSECPVCKSEEDYGWWIMDLLELLSPEDSGWEDAERGMLPRFPHNPDYMDGYRSAIYG